ncbi:ENTH/ANTH/VHS superfamily protein [Melia azedarach]|uniref:ENTH/ANTH/VHS superfamily protein n=1 Tax=Melia azedarach TaxID=155640 RepID=A0ACC1WRA0_MELAZ|nr:ENTH/ANTH/VHS superfamily protein [Melia azedarach]
MGRLKKSRLFFGILKDKVSLIKTALSTRRQTSSIRRGIIRATTHGSSSPPPDEIIDAVLSSGNGSRPRACTCIQALMDRLHGTHNAFVALKCLYTVHHIITRGSFILKDQLSIYPSFGGRNFLNLSTFHDDSDPERWELSSWGRWYAGILEQNLSVSRVLGYYLSSSNGKDKEEMVLASVTPDLLRELDSLVAFVQEISNVPNSFHLQRNDLVYEIVRLVSEDYRLIQREIFLRVVELGERTMSLSLDELIQVSSGLQKLEDCKDRLLLLFANRKKNDRLWELIRESNKNISTAVSKRIEEKALVKMWRRDESSELTLVRERFAVLGQALQLKSGGGGGGALLGLDRVPLTVSTVR